MKHRSRLIPIVPILIVMAVVVAGTAFFTSTRSAHADIEGPCSASIAGVDVAGLDPNDPGDAIDVDYEDDVVVSMSSSEGFRSHTIELEFARYLNGDATVEDREDAGETSFTKTVDVSDWAWAGVGLYKVKGKATLTDGTTCKGAALIDVGGRHPLITIAGGVSALVGVVVTTLAVAAFFAGASGTPGSLNAIRQMVEAAETQGAEAAQERARMTSSTGLLGGMIGWLSILAISLVMTPLMMAAGGGSGDAPSGDAQPAATTPPESTRLPRAPWLPRITVLGIIYGLLVGIAGVVLLQQFSVVYSDLWVAIGLLAAGVAVYGLLLPTMAYTVAWLRMNRHVDEVERALNSG
jgi:hypothetical protein